MVLLPLLALLLPFMRFQGVNSWATMRCLRRPARPSPRPSALFVSNKKSKRGTQIDPNVALSSEHEKIRVAREREPLTTFRTKDRNDPLSRCIDTLCGKPLSNSSFSGVFLTSQDGATAIKALIQPDTAAIVGVPVDSRDYCKNMLNLSTTRPGSKGRMDLLCSAACPGSGKSVVL